MAPPTSPTDAAEGEVVDTFRQVIGLAGRLLAEDGDAVLAAHPTVGPELAMLRQALTEVGEALDR